MEKFIESINSFKKEIKANRSSLDTILEANRNSLKSDFNWVKSEMDS